MTLFQDITRKPLPDNYHHPLSASKKRWLYCPASASIPDTKEAGDAAKFGNLVHEYADRLSRGLLPSDNTVDTQALQAAQKYLEAVKPYLAGCDEVKTEWRVYLDGVPTLLFDTLSGTADKVGVSEFGPLIIVDLKTGFVDVPVEDNDQMDFYGLGAYWALKPEVRATITGILEIIIQVNGRVGVQVKECWKSVDDLLGWADKATTAVEACETTPDVFVGGWWCSKTYCPKAMTCEAHHAYLSELVGGEITDLDPEDVPVDIEEIERLLDAVPTVKAWCKLVEERGLQLALLSPEEFNRYKVVASFGHYKFKDENRFIAKARKAGVSDDIFKPRQLKSKTELEKTPFVKELLSKDMFYRPSAGYDLKPL